VACHFPIEAKDLPKRIDLTATPGGEGTGEDDGMNADYLPANPSDDARLKAPGV
jgi:hypothetical protein